MLDGIVTADPLLIYKLLNRFIKADFDAVVSALGFEHPKRNGGSTSGSGSGDSDSNDAAEDDDGNDAALVDEDEVQGHKIDPEEYRTKAFLIEELRRRILLKGGLTHHQLAQLDLLHVRIKKTSRKWSCYHASIPSAANRGNTQDTARLKRACSAAMDTFFPNHVEVDSYPGSRHCILRIHIGQRINASSMTAFVAVVPGEPYFASTAMKEKYRAHVHRAVAQTLGYAKVEAVDLDGQHPGDLLTLLIQKESQGHAALYRDGLYDISPLNRRQYKKPKASGKHLPKPDVLTLDDASHHQTVAQHEFNAFGTQKPPRLEKLQFEFETPFKGGLELDALFHCAVKIEGSDVIAGVRDLATQGLARTPLPPFLTHVASTGTNKRYITVTKE